MSGEGLEMLPARVIDCEDRRRAAAGDRAGNENGRGAQGRRGQGDVRLVRRCDARDRLRAVAQTTELDAPSTTR